jgi:hypothetical protein
MTDEPHRMVLYEADTARSCGGCSLCCRLLPMPELHKPANTRCQHQKFKKGCAIYARRPSSCMHWSCRWLLGNDTADMPRPDRCHYVLDPMPDFITMRSNETGETVVHYEAVQIWLDPRFPDAHKDPALRRYLERRAEERTVGLIRLSGQEAFALFAPSMSEDRQWHEVRTTAPVGKQHSLEDYFAAQRENDAIAKRMAKP